VRIHTTLTARLAAIALLVGATMALSGASADAASCATPVEKAACEIIAAKDRANRAAQAWVDAETKLDDLNVRLTTLGDEATALQVEVDAMQVGVEELALQRFLDAGAGAGLFTGLEGPTEQVEAEALGRFATNTAETSIDSYQSAKAELDARLIELDAVRADTEQAKATYDVMRQRALDDVAAYKKAYEKAVKDEQVRRALEAQEAERKRIAKQKAEQDAAEAARVAEVQRQQAAVARPQPGGGGSSNNSGGSSSGGGSSNGGGTGGSGGSSSSGGGTGGGSSGGGGGTVDGGNSGGGSGNSGGSGGAYVADINCPVDGPNAFGDTWGAPRSGGRRHEGVDMISPTGTHLIAVTSGYVQFKQTPLGGSSVWLNGNDGNRYYYAHLSEFEGESRNVERGELIGYVGDSGNARGTPHLHFEVHPGGGAAVNPTPTVRAAGC
jgi:peptidoglycan LD-endopeptidase LytH